jgi:hypothetical protein
MIYLRVGVAMLIAAALKAAAHNLVPGELLHKEVHGIGYAPLKAAATRLSLR